MKNTDVLPTSIRLTPELKEALRLLAERDDRSLGNYIIRVLRDHVEAKRAKIEHPTNSRETVAS